MMDLMRGMRPVLPELRRELDRLFEGFVGPHAANWNGGVAAYPALNLWEDQENLYAEAEVPGSKMNEIELFIRGNELAIKGMRRPVEGEEYVYHRRERGVGEFARYVTLPMEVEADRVEASLRDGVLRITMPKAQQARTRKITVKSS